MKLSNKNSNNLCQIFYKVILLSYTKPVCRKQYIGETGRPAYVRFKEHLDTAEDPDTTNPIGQHFQSAGHTKTDMKMIPFEKVQGNGNSATRKQREGFFINTYNLIIHVLNLGRGTNWPIAKIFSSTLLFQIVADDIY